MEEGQGVNIQPEYNILYQEGGGRGRVWIHNLNIISYIRRGEGVNTYDPTYSYINMNQCKKYYEKFKYFKNKFENPLQNYFAYSFFSHP